MSLNTLYRVVDILGSTRSSAIGRFANKGTTTAVTLDAENPWPFSSFMVTTAGNVSISDRFNQPMTFPACQPGTQYWATGIRVLSTGTTATGIFVYGGV